MSLAASSEPMWPEQIGLEQGQSVGEKPCHSNLQVTLCGSQDSDPAGTPPAQLPLAFTGSHTSEGPQGLKAQEPRWT